MTSRPCDFSNTIELEKEVLNRKEKVCKSQKKARYRNHIKDNEMGEYQVNQT